MGDGGTWQVLDTIFDNISCVESNSFHIEVVIFIPNGIEHLILCLHMLTIIGGKVIATLIAKHKVGVIHV